MKFGRFESQGKTFFGLVEGDQVVELDGSPFDAWKATTKKHALSALARALRLELQGFGIKVTEVAPGMVDTDIRVGSDHPDVLASVANRKFKPLTAQEVADAVVYALQANPNCCPDLIELRPQGAF